MHFYQLNILCDVSSKAFIKDDVLHYVKHSAHDKLLTMHRILCYTDSKPAALPIFHQQNSTSSIWLDRDAQTIPLLDTETHIGIRWRYGGHHIWPSRFLALHSTQNTCCCSRSSAISCWSHNERRNRSIHCCLVCKGQFLDWRYSFQDTRIRPIGCLLPDNSDKTGML